MTRNTIRGPGPSRLQASGLITALTMTALLAATPLQASTVSYYLDQNNSSRPTGGIDFLHVTIADGTDGAIDFRIEAASALASRVGSRLDIRSFGFNFDGTLELTKANIAGLPDGYRVRKNMQQSSFGRFDLVLLGTGAQRIDVLTFSIVGIDGDTPLSYVQALKGKNSTAFTAHLRGLLARIDGSCTTGVGRTGGPCDPRVVSSAFVGGASPVPLPAGGWLAITAVLATTRFLRRRSSVR